ncbi:uncharacterized protein LOC122849638 [Aphidius gifuensis]|uniref:uncharacterized protein LOC122849638 n=1 Tax=Aphidius gifuensis TaxID=684658 RepID=UPI001CDD3E92|nr:uncharacterized protein LOC122849638 [Aphidius gifuensis]
MFGLLRQPLLKSVRIAQFGVKNFAQPIPRVFQKSYGRFRRTENVIHKYDYSEKTNFMVASFGGDMTLLVLCAIIWFNIFMMIQSDPEKPQTNKKKSPYMIQFHQCTITINNFYFGQSPQTIKHK